MALVTLLDDLWQEQDGVSGTILTLLDPSVAFDTIGRGILLCWLWGLGLGGTAQLLSPKPFPISVNRE